MILIQVILHPICVSKEATYTHTKNNVIARTSIDCCTKSQPFLRNPRLQNGQGKKLNITMWLTSHCGHIIQTSTSNVAQYYKKKLLKTKFTIDHHTHLHDSEIMFSCEAQIKKTNRKNGTKTQAPWENQRKPRGIKKQWTPKLRGGFKLVFLTISVF